MTIQDRLAEVFPVVERGLQAEIARLVGKSKPSVSAWFNNPVKVQSMERTDAEIILAHFKKPHSPAWLAEGTLPKMASDVTDKRVEAPHVVTPVHEGAPRSLPINLHYAKGSCGGGHLNGDEAGKVKQQLVKEESWFIRYGVKPDDVFAIYADGDSMADFIVDGDIVFFDKRHLEIVSGKIYAIDTPDGTKIKRIHRRADGSVVLSSDNTNKAKYPEEAYTEDEANRLIVRGQYFYRQG